MAKARKKRLSKDAVDPEAWKTLVALLYFLFSTFVSSIAMVIVHDRVPDMLVFPPLPDIVLDNVPVIPWAFVMCEYCGLVLLYVFCVILLFHKYRAIILRRLFSIIGSVFLLRSVTMLITSLSVPGRHLKCTARTYDNWLDRLSHVFMIWQGFGLSIGEYTPGNTYYGHILHTAAWIVNLFGVFFILAAHEHYSIDVFIAFYISTRLFLYYHTLANSQNNSNTNRDRDRTRIWFPLFYFFESNVRGMVPNEFESPLQAVKECRFSCYLTLGAQNLVKKFHESRYFNRNKKRIMNPN